MNISRSRAWRVTAQVWKAESIPFGRELLSAVQGIVHQTETVNDTA